MTWPPSPQASCVVDIVDSSGWTALHHAGGYTQPCPALQGPEGARLGAYSTQGSGALTSFSFLLAEYPWCVRRWASVTLRAAGQ